MEYELQIMHTPLLMRQFNEKFQKQALKKNVGISEIINDHYAISQQAWVPTQTESIKLCASYKS